MVKNLEDKGAQSPLKKGIRNSIETLLITGLVFGAFEQKQVIGFLAPYYASFMQTANSLIGNRFTNVFGFIKNQGMIPFTDPLKVKNEIIGSVIVFFLIAISNMAGISGAFNIIPMMMLFNDMSMKQAVPLASFAAMCASLLRYITNFK